MRIVYHLPNDDLVKARDTALAAELAGFDGVVALENAHGPFPPLSVAALSTQKIQLGTGVAIAFPRSPTIMAHAAWDLHKASLGRFHLGIGSQVRGHNERRYGVAWTAPAPRMRDYIGAVHALWDAWETGEPINYQSEHYALTLTTPNFSPKPTGLSRIPISIAALGPGMTRVAGDVADGIRLHPFHTRRYVTERCLTELQVGLDRSGRARSDIEVIAGAFLATGPDSSTVERMLEYIRFRIAFYCSTRAYWHVLRLHGLEALGEHLRDFPAQGRWSEMAAQIPDDIVSLFAMVGTYDEIPEQLEARYGGLIDTVDLYVPPGTDPASLSPVVDAAHRLGDQGNETHSTRG